MINAIIVDDEKDCRESIKSLIKQCCNNVNISGEASSVEEGLDCISKKQPDLLLLDVELSDGTSFDLLNQIINPNFQIIFITAFDKYAIQAIRHSAIDYILKPVNPDLFKKAVIKAINLIENNDQIAKQVKILLDNRNSFNRMALPTIDGLRFINISDILYLKSEANYTWFLLNNNEKILVTKTLKEFDETLSENTFVRIHQSYLININYVEKYIKGQGGSVIMTNGTELLVSRRKKEHFINTISRPKKNRKII